MNYRWLQIFTISIISRFSLNEKTRRSIETKILLKLILPKCFMFVFVEPKSMASRTWLIPVRLVDKRVRNVWVIISYLLSFSRKARFFLWPNLPLYIIYLVHGCAADIHVWPAVTPFTIIKMQYHFHFVSDSSKWPKQIYFGLFVLFFLFLFYEPYAFCVYFWWCWCGWVCSTGGSTISS